MSTFNLLVFGEHVATPFEKTKKLKECRLLWTRLDLRIDFIINILLTALNIYNGKPQ